MAAAQDEEKRVLRHFLEYQRASVLSIVGGLSEEAWPTSAVPSGWTPAGLVEHLGDAERHWFQQVVTGSEVDLPWDEGRPPYDPEAAFTCGRPGADIIAYYREQCERTASTAGPAWVCASKGRAASRPGTSPRPGA